MKVAQANHPNLRFSFTLATLGGNSPQSLGAIGVNVMNSIKSSGLTGYYVNLMAMDYGSAIASNCTLGGNGKCDMAQSAINSAINLHNYWGVPYNQIEVTPMIGGNDAHRRGVHASPTSTPCRRGRRPTAWRASTSGRSTATSTARWAAPRPPATATARAGTWGFTNRFISDLGL